MPFANIEISCEIDVPEVKGTIDFEKKLLPAADLDKFVSGELGEHYLSILVPNDDIYSELHAPKSGMKKKGALFEITKNGNGVKVKVQGTFKVNAYAHVLERLKNAPDKIFITGLYCGEWPPFGGDFSGVDKDKNAFPITGKLI